MNVADFEELKVIGIKTNKTVTVLALSGSKPNALSFGDTRIYEKLYLQKFIYENPSWRIDKLSVAPFDKAEESLKEIMWDENLPRVEPNSTVDFPAILHFRTANYSLDWRINGLKQISIVAERISNGSFVVPSGAYTIVGGLKKGKNIIDLDISKLPQGVSDLPYEVKIVLRQKQDVPVFMLKGHQVGKITKFFYVQ